MKHEIQITKRYTIATDGEHCGDENALCPWYRPGGLHCLLFVERLLKSANGRSVRVQECLDAKEVTE